MYCLITFNLHVHVHVYMYLPSLFILLLPVLSPPPELSHSALTWRQHKDGCGRLWPSSKDKTSPVRHCLPPSLPSPPPSLPLLAPSAFHYAYHHLHTHRLHVHVHSTHSSCMYTCTCSDISSCGGVGLVCATIPAPCLWLTNWMIAGVGATDVIMSPHAMYFAFHEFQQCLHFL